MDIDLLRPWSQDILEQSKYTMSSNNETTNVVKDPKEVYEEEEKSKDEKEPQTNT